MIRDTYNQSDNLRSLGGAGEVFFVLESAGLSIGKATTTTINDGQWHHVVGTWQADADTPVAPQQFQIYTDGVPQTSTTADNCDVFGLAPVSPVSGLEGTQVGREPVWGTYLNGSVDELLVYDRALSGEEVGTLYNDGLGYTGTIYTPEGTEIPLQAGINGSEDTPAYFWTVTDAYGDVVETYSGPDYPFTPPDDGTYTVTLAAALPGVNVAAEFADILVSDVPPTASISGPATGVAGTEVDLTASALDAGAVDALMGFSYDWSVTKNGNDFTSGYGPNIQFTPDAAGTYVVSVTATDAYGIASDPATANVTVAAAPSVVCIAASIPSASESDQSPGEFTVTRDGDTSAALTVAYTIDTASTATLDVDYVELSGSVMFAVGSDTATIAVTPLDAGKVGGSVYLTVHLDDRNGNFIANSDYSAATVTICDDDLPTVGIVASEANATESGTPGEFTVSRNGPTDEPLFVSYSIGGTNAVNGDDYEMLCGDVIITAGDSSATIAITPIDTRKAGPDGAIVLTLVESADYSVSASADTATITLAYDDLPTVSLATVNPFCSSSEETSAEFRVSRTGSLDDPLAVAYSVYTIGENPALIDSGTVTISADSASATLEIAEPSGLAAGDSVQVALSAGEGYALAGGAATATATAVDSSVIVQSVYTTTPVILDCGAVPGNITIVLSQAPPDTVTVEIALGGTASYWTDYTLAAADGGDCTIYGATASVTFDAETTQRTLSVMPSSSPSALGKTVIASPLGGSGYLPGTGGSGIFSVQPDGSEATVTIADDVPEVTISDSVAVEGDYETVTVTLSHAMNYPIDLSYTTVDGTAEAGTDYAFTSSTLGFAANTTELTKTITVQTYLDVGNTLREAFSILLQSYSDAFVKVVKDSQEGVKAAKGTLTPENADGKPATGAVQIVYVGQTVLLGVKTGPGGILGKYRLYYDSTYVQVCKKDGTPVPSGLIVPPDLAVTAYVKGISPTMRLNPPDLTTDVVLRYETFAQSKDLSKATYAVDKVEMYWTDAGSDITGGTESTQVGRMTNLKVVDIHGNAVSGKPTIRWGATGYRIRNFSVGGPPQYVEDLKEAIQIDTTGPETHFVWVEGGDQCVMATVTFSGSSPIGLGSTFNVERPDANARVTMEDYENKSGEAVTLPIGGNSTWLGQGKGGMNTFAGANGPMAGFQGGDAAGNFVPGARFTADPTDRSDFTFSWVQVLTFVKVSESRNYDVRAGMDVSWNPVNPNPDIGIGGKKLDNRYTYLPQGTTQFTTWDNPRWAIPPAIATPVSGRALSFTFAATMWYMASPSANGVGDAVPVPLAEVRWSCHFIVAAARVLTPQGWQMQWKMMPDARHSPSAPMVSTYQHPKWTMVATNSPSAN
jgi:hypothetical protein